MTNYSVRNLFKEEIKSHLIDYLYLHIRWGYDYEIEKPEDLYFLVSPDNSTLMISLGLESQEIIDRLNSDEYILEQTKRELEKWARYRGPFRFTVGSSDDDIPF